MRPLLILLTLAACSSDPTGPGGSALPSGTYNVTTGTQPPGFSFTVIDANPTYVAIDWTFGDVRGGLPVRDTAIANGEGYRVDWHGVEIGTNYWINFTATSCRGAQVFGSLNGAITTVEWPNCQIGRPPA